MQKISEFFETFIGSEVTKGISIHLESKGIHIPHWINITLSFLFDNLWWGWVVFLLPLFFIQKISKKFSKNTFISLEEAASIFHDTHKLSDVFLNYVVPSKQENLVDKFFEEKNKDRCGQKNILELDFKTSGMINILIRFFYNGMLPLYGENSPGKKLDKIMLRDIQALYWENNYSALYYDSRKTELAYKNLKCKKQELLRFIENNKDELLNEDNLSQYSYSHPYYKNR